MKWFKFRSNYLKKQTGQVLPLALVVLMIAIVTTVVLMRGSVLFSQTSKYSLQVEEATLLAEAGIDKAVASLNRSGGSYTGEAETLLGSGAYSVEVTSESTSTKLIKATGYIPSKSNPKVARVITIKASKGAGVAFNYGVQVGDGGLQVDQQSVINGGVYSNGSINLDQQTSINGDTYVAGGTQPVPDQQAQCAAPNCSDYIFGKSVGSESRLDIAQSFKPSSTSVLNKVALNLKKVGSPPNITVRILGDSGGSPNKNNIIATGTLSANLVTNSFSFVEVGFSSAPTLIANTTYWIVFDTSNNVNNYWIWSNDTAQGYNCSPSNCSPKWSTNWSASNPIWNAILPGDLDFKIYMGGVVTSVTSSGSGGNIARINGSVYANTLANLRVQDQAFYQFQSNVTAGGQNCTSNPSSPKCNPGSADPPPQPMPISEAQIAQWKDEADNNVFTGNITNCPTTLVSGKYEGNITLPSHCTVTVESPIWVTGNFMMNQQSRLRLMSTYGTSSGVFIVDGIISINQQNSIQGSCYQNICSNGSYLILLSEFNSKDDPGEDPAIIVNQQGNTGILYSNKGKIEIHQQNTFTEVTAWKLHLHQQVTVNYDTGLAGSFFSSGPSGSFALVKGTYQVK